MDKVKALSQAFSEEASYFYGQMLPEYQTGYAAYVYQTDLADWQRRRIKNLERLLYRWRQEPSFYLQPLADKHKDVLSDLGWSSSTNDCSYIELIGYGVLMGLAHLRPLDTGLAIDLQLFPLWSKEGLALASYQALENYVRKNHPQAEYLSSDCFDFPFNQAFYLKQGYQLVQTDQSREQVIKFLEG